MLTSFKRITKIGLKSFWRNPTLSVATVLIMTMVVFLITVLFMLNGITKELIINIQDKVDIAVYFKPEAKTENTIDLKAKLTNMPEVKEVIYISKDDALKTFSEKHKDNPVLMESLTEVGANPFIDSLTIKVKEESQYPKVADYLKGLPDEMQIKNIDYFERKSMIDKAVSMAGGIKKGVLWISVILAIVAIFIAFNTIKIAILNSREEVSVMRLVGASNVFIRGPFLVEGLLIGVLATIIVAVASFVFSYGFNDSIKSYSGISTFQIYIANFWLLLLLQLVSGILLGFFSSFIAIRKHLRS